MRIPPSRVCILSWNLVRLRASEVHSRGKMKFENEIGILQFFQKKCIFSDPYIGVLVKPGKDLI